MTKRGRDEEELINRERERERTGVREGIRESKRRKHGGQGRCDRKYRQETKKDRTKDEEKWR